MNVGGITSNYPIEYGIKRTQKTTPDGCFAGRTERVNSRQGYVLHCFDNEA